MSEEKKQCDSKSCDKKSCEERISGMNKAQRKQILELLDELEEKPNT